MEGIMKAWVALRFWNKAFWQARTWKVEPIIGGHFTLYACLEVNSNKARLRDRTRCLRLIHIQLSIANELSI